MAETKYGPLVRLSAESFLSTRVSTNVKLERFVFPVFSIDIITFFESPTSV